MNFHLNSPQSVLRIIFYMFSLTVFATVAHANFLLLEYITPADLSQGKQQNTTLAPDDGVDAMPEFACIALAIIVAFCMTSYYRR